MKKFVFAAALTSLSMPSSANDSSAAIGLGGLELTQNDAISMDSEDLFLSRALVRVKYKFTNISAKDVETFVSFPLPSIPKGVGGYMGDQSYPNWQVQAHVTREQVFPAGKTMVVEHSYKPVIGGSVGGMLERASRKEQGFKGYAAAYCIDQSFIKGFDKRRCSRRKESDGNEVDQFYVEHWLDYVLKSGANWKGPIKDLRLVADKDKPGNLLSLCMTGVRKISPTQFEVRKTNFEPTQDIRILIAEFYDPNA